MLYCQLRITCRKLLSSLVTTSQGHCTNCVVENVHLKRGQIIMCCKVLTYKNTETQRSHSTATTASALHAVGSSDDRQQTSLKADFGLDARLSDENINLFKDNLQSRHSSFDLQQLMQDYKIFKNLSEQKDRLSDERTHIAKTMADIVKGKSLADPQTKESLIRQGAEIKEQLRSIMTAWWEAEGKVLSKAMKLPADLHPETPLCEDKILETCEGMVEVKGDPVSHLLFAENCGQLKFSGIGPRAVYLMGDLAVLETSLLQYSASKLLSAGLQQIACPEIFRTPVVEGCGLDSSNANEVFTLNQKEDSQKANAFHLKGNSLLSYAAFFTKQQMKGSLLPLKMFAVGRHYKLPENEDLPGLYGTIQSNRVTVFAACKDPDQATDTQKMLTHLVWDIVKNLGLPARLVLVKPSSLSASESLRAEAQVWAPGLKAFIQVAAVSNHSDYVSRRLMTFHDGNVQGQDRGYVHMVSGVALDINRCLAAMLEYSNHEGKFQLLCPPCLEGRGPKV